MPRYTTDGNALFVSIVTGPHHVLLGLVLVESPRTEIVLTSLPPVGRVAGLAIDPEMVAEAVGRGVAAANSRFGTAYNVAEVIFVEDDTNRKSLFQRCAELIVERVAKELPFEPKG